MRRESLGARGGQDFVEEEVSQKKNKHPENKLGLMIPFCQEWVCFSGCLRTLSDQTTSHSEVQGARNR